MPLSLRPHEYQTTRQGIVVAVTKFPYLRLARGLTKGSPDGESPPPPIFLQGGSFWAEGGDAIPDDELPDWVFTEMKKCSRAALEECGFGKWAEENLTDGNNKITAPRAHSR